MMAQLALFQNYGDVFASTYSGEWQGRRVFDKKARSVASTGRSQLLLLKSKT
jgi:hypothetical protein